MNAHPKWMFEPPTQPDPKTKRDPEAQHRAEALYKAATDLLEMLTPICSDGGLGGLRGRIAPVVLGALDRQLAHLETIAHDLIHAPNWVGPHGRKDCRYRRPSRPTKKPPRETHDWPIPADHPGVR